MSALQGLRARLRSLFFRRAADRSVAEEIRFHLEMETERLVREGLASAEARRRARLEFGGVDRYMEEVRDGRRLGWVEDVWRDLRHGARSLRHAPGFTVTVVLILALGIGLGTAVFTVADTLLVKKLPVVDESAIVVLAAAARDRSMEAYPVALEDVREFTRRTRSLERVAFLAYPGVWTRVVRDGSRTWRLHYSAVSGGFFAVLGARPVLGRPLSAEDDIQGARPVLVLSYRAWQERFGGAPDIVGRRIVMNEDGTTYTVVGVMPRGLDYPRGADAWVAVRALLPERALSRAAFYMVGRLQSGSGPAAAAAELSAYFQRAGAGPAERKLLGTARPLPRLVVGDARPAILTFAAAAALLLLITCIDIANLLLVRGLSRVRELAVRVALGAGRARIFGQFLMEHVLLALFGGLLGVVVAAGAVRAFTLLAPRGFPRLAEIGLNGAALGGAAAITGAVIVLFALAPALLASRTNAQEVLRVGPHQSMARRSRRATKLLAVGQVALALVVLSAAALVGRSFFRLEHADLALDPTDLLVAELAFPSRYGSAPEQIAVLERILPAVDAIPGVRAASPTVAAPFAVGWDGALRAEGQSAEDAEANPLLNMDVVGPGYFATLGLPVLRGRGFTPADRTGASRVVVLSRSAARRYWGTADAIGRRLVMGEGKDRWTLTVVGVVPDARYRELREGRPSIYFPLLQSTFPYAPTRLVIRTGGDPGAVVPALQRVLAGIDPGIGLAHAAPFASYLQAPLAEPRLDALLLAAFALAAVALGAIGLFGVLATGVRHRRRELGIRIALGASSARVGWLVLREGLGLAAAGIALGLLGALAANRLLSALLYGITPTDPATLAAAATLLLCVAGLASSIPVRAGARIDPIQAIRAE